MKIAVLGATGPSGLQVVQEALERGHEVTAIVRNPEKLVKSVKDEKLTVILYFSVNIFYFNNTSYIHVINSIQ